MDNDNSTFAGASEWSAWAQCIDGIGTQRFYRSLLEAVDLAGGFQHISVYAFTAEFEPQIRTFESLGSHHVTVEATHLYMSTGLHRQDPARGRLRRLDKESETPILFVLRAEEVPDPVYRSQIYESFDLAGRVSLVGQCNGAWQAIHFYKHRRPLGLSDRDIAAVARRAGLIFAAHRQHIASEQGRRDAGSPALPPLEFLRRVLQEVAPALSAREREVCALALRGFSGGAIAFELGVAETTVATLRRRAYAKLQISALNELFALCLRAVSLGSQKSAEEKMSDGRGQ